MAVAMIDRLVHHAEILEATPFGSPLHSPSLDGDEGGIQDDRLIDCVAAVAGVLIAAAIVDEADAGGLGARQAWLYVRILTVGYMVSRGLAKSGSREPYDADDS